MMIVDCGYLMIVASGYVLIVASGYRMIVASGKIQNLPSRIKMNEKDREGCLGEESSLMDNANIENSPPTPELARSLNGKVLSK